VLRILRLGPPPSVLRRTASITSFLVQQADAGLFLFDCQVTARYLVLAPGALTVCKNCWYLASVLLSQTSVSPSDFPTSFLVQQAGAVLFLFDTRHSTALYSCYARYSTVPGMYCLFLVQQADAVLFLFDGCAGQASYQGTWR